MKQKKTVSSSLKRFVFTLIYLLVAAALAACSNSSPVNEAAQGKLKVTTTTEMIANIVENVGAKLFEVMGLMKAGVQLKRGVR